jgi:DNA-binding CsgD family transcriptional regulator
VVRRSPEERDRRARHPWALARGVLRRAGAAAASGGRQRCQLLAHARSADPAADQRRTARAGRGGHLHAGHRGRRGRGAGPQRVQSDDRNTFAELATRRVPVGILAQATRGKPERTARYRELLEPSGIPHELRAAFVRRGRVWGAVHVARRESSGAFSDRDADVLDAQGEVELVTPPALPILAAIGAPGIRPEEGELPSAVHALAAFVREQGAAAEGANVVTVPGRDGLVTLHASKPDPVGDRIAIVIEAARGPRAATVRLEAAGATAREREVATLIARGLTNPEIAETLVLSPHTVGDHVKSLFDKLDVASRQELVARVFLDEYLPEVIQQTPLTSHGRFEVN